MEWPRTPVFLPGEFHGQRSLASYSPWHCKELDKTEGLTHTHTHYCLKEVYISCPDCCSYPFHVHCVLVPLPHQPVFPSPDCGLRYDLFHRFLPLAFPFFEIYRQREGWGTALFQSVITHYYTFIHTGCKVPWVLRRLSRGGVRSLRRPLLTKAKMSATFLMVSPST